MPYKHEKIFYSLPHDGYNKELFNEYGADLCAALGLSRELVGVKLFFSEEEYENCTAPEPLGKQLYCAMVEKAGRGKGYKSRLQHHNCDGGTTALCLERSTPQIESGQVYYSYGLYSCPSAAGRLRRSINSLHNQEQITFGISVQPLSQCQVQPDVIISVCNPYQAMRIVQGWVYQGGKKPEIDLGAMQAICSEVTAYPYLSGELNVSMLCPSTRMLNNWKDQDLAVGIPSEKFEETVRGVMATINSTDVDKRKKEIMERFAARGKDLPLILK